MLPHNNLVVDRTLRQTVCRVPFFQANLALQIVRGSGNNLLLQERNAMKGILKRSSYIVVAIFVVCLGCDAVNPFIPKTTHMMDEIVTDVYEGRGYYRYVYAETEEIITIKATVEKIGPKPELLLFDNIVPEPNAGEPEDRLKLETNHPRVIFYLDAVRGKYKVGRTYTFRFWIDYISSFYVDTGNPFYIIYANPFDNWW